MTNDALLEKLRTFVKITPCVVEGEPDAHIARFKVGPQEFSLTPFASETRQEAEWMKEMFCNALAAMIGQLAHPQADAPALATMRVKLILHCPKCGLQHVDAPDERTPDWSNPPHRSHLCHGCGHIWRPADVPTEGVREIETQGKADSPLSGAVAAPREPSGPELTPQIIAKAAEYVIKNRPDRTFDVVGAIMFYNAVVSAAPIASAVADGLEQAAQIADAHAKLSSSIASDPRRTPEDTKRFGSYAIAAAHVAVKIREAIPSLARLTPDKADGGTV